MLPIYDQHSPDFPTNYMRRFRPLRRVASGERCASVPPGRTSPPRGRRRASFPDVPGRFSRLLLHICRDPLVRSAISAFFTRMLNTQQRFEPSCFVCLF